MRSLTGTRRRRRTSAFSLMEVLIAGVILATTVVAMMQFVWVDYTMTSKSTNMSAATSIGRSAIEETKLAGFANAPEGTQTSYFDSAGDYPASTTATASTVYKCVINIVSDQLNGSTPAAGALRAVTVTVSLNSSGLVVYTTYTSLASGGV